MNQLEIQPGQQALIQQAKRHGFGPFRGYDHKLATVTRVTKQHIFVVVDGDPATQERRFVKATMIEYGKVDYHTPEVRLILDQKQIEAELYQQADREQHQQLIGQGRVAVERLLRVFGQNSIHHRTAAELNSLIELADRLAPETQKET